MDQNPLILVVEDDEDDRYMIKEAFQEHAPDCNLTFSTDGQEGLNYLTEAEKLPTLVVMDLNMPRLNGFELLQRLRGQSRFKGLPVVIFSTTHQTEQINRAYELGATHFITKPSSLSELGTLALSLCQYCTALIKGHKG